MNQEIKNWLESEKDYSEGVSLYDRFGPSQNLKRIFARAECSENNMATLIYELGKCINSEVSAPKRISRVVPPPVATPVFDVKKIKYSPTDPGQILYQEIIRKIKIRDLIHGALSGTMSQEKRKNDALMILQLSEEIREGYETLDIYASTGEMPPKELKKQKRALIHVLECDREEMIKQRNYARSHVCRYKKLNEKTDLSTKLQMQYSTQLLFWEVRLLEFDKALDNAV